jgi:hypothetical protein
MMQQCYVKKDPKQPVCAVHNVVLEQNRISIDSNAPGLGQITCYLCPVSRAVVQEPRNN